MQSSINLFNEPIDGVVAATTQGVPITLALVVAAPLIAPSFWGAFPGMSLGPREMNIE